MGKPQTQRIESGDCLVEVGGVSHALHEGEWVEVMPGLTVDEYKVQTSLLRLQLEIVNADEPEKRYEFLQKAEETLDQAISILARRIIAWTWTNDNQERYPSPPGADVLRTLRMEEMAYLLQAVTGQNPVARKNGMRPLQITTSDTQPMVSPT